jgi:hypothetical protein
MITANKRQRTRSVGTRLSAEQYATVQAQADAQGLGMSEHIRSVLLSAPSQADAIKRSEAIAQVQLEENQALHSFLLNVIIAYASGEVPTPQRILAMRDHANAIKGARARALLSAATNKGKQRSEKSAEEAA